MSGHDLNKQDDNDMCVLTTRICSEKPWPSIGKASRLRLQSLALARWGDPLEGSSRQGKCEGDSVGRTRRPDEINTANTPCELTITHIY